MKAHLYSFLGFGGVFIIALMSLWLSSPPDIIPSGAPLKLFSAERAAIHLEKIAGTPNPLGTAANDNVTEQPGSEM